MCLTHDSNPRAACGLKGPFRLVEVVYPHTQTNKQTTWSRPRLQDRSPRDIVVKSYKKQLTYPMLMAPHWTKLADWLEIISPQVMFLFKMLTFPGTSWKSVNLGSFRCHLSSAHAQGLGARSPKWTPLGLWKTNMIHSEVSSCHACTILHSDVLSWTQKPRAEDPPRMQLVMLKTFCLLQVYIYILI